MSGMASKGSEENQENTCIVCYKGVEIYSIGQCDHPVCYECSTRMRVLCLQNECPICRQDMPTVIFTEKIQPFRDPKNSHYLRDDKFKIVFESDRVRRAYHVLLAHNCPKCDGKSFPNFGLLKEHVRRVHQLNYCDLCISNLKILTRERRCYTRQELATHRRHGDPDDRSHRGHPLCQFCDTRFMDNDDLYRHLRRQHLYCHFCDADGYDHYYSTYDFLREHFRSEHFLCEEGDCYDEKFTSVFRSEIDLKAHRASVHGRAIGKAAAKQARTLELEFTLAPRPRMPNRNRNREEEMEVGAVGGSEDSVVFTQLNTDCMEEFPSLGGKGSPQPNPMPSHQSKLTIRSSTRGFTINDENFPALGPEATVSLHVNSERPISSVVNTKQPNLSIQVNHRSSGFTTRVSSSSGPREDFPALSGKANSPVVNIATTQWSSSKKPEPKVSLIKQRSEPPMSSKQMQPKSFHMDNDFPSLSSQFNSSCTLPKEAKPSKSTSVPHSASSNWGTSFGAHSSDSDTVPVASTRSKKKKSKSKNTVSSGFSEPGSSSSKKGLSQYGSSKVHFTDDINKGKKKSKETHQQEKFSVPVNTLKNTEEYTNNNTIVNNNNKINGKINLNTNTRTVAEEKKKGDKKFQSKQAKDKIMDEEEFPALSRSRPPGFSDVSRVPPGFDVPKWEVAKPPPGLESVKVPPGLEPPPGFPMANGSFPPLIDRNSYVHPSDFAKRNTALINKVLKVIGREELDNFKEISVAFRNSLISAEEYYSHCEDIIGVPAFLEIFPELLALLPDINKQQELWPVYKANRGKESTKKNKLDACATCGQIVKSADLRDHLSNHSLQNHFPALNGAPGLNKAWSNK